MLSLRTRFFAFLPRFSAPSLLAPSLLAALLLSFAPLGSEATP
jgi:hypothetical protein